MGAVNQDKRKRKLAELLSSLFLRHTVRGSCETDSKGEKQTSSSKLLHLCKRGPSLHEVKVIVQKYGLRSLKSINSDGQTPLHVATAHGADTDVLLYLITKYPEACSTSDNQGRLPLHYLAAARKWFSIELYHLEEDIGCDQTCEDTLDSGFFKVLHTMCLLHPAGVLHDDCAGRNPIECAVLDKSPISVIRAVQKHSVSLWRKTTSYENLPLLDSAVTVSLAVKAKSSPNLLSEPNSVAFSGS